MTSMHGIQAGLRHHHHHGECDPGGNCGPGPNQGLRAAGEGLVQAGGQLVQLGQELMEAGDAREGMQLSREGFNLEQQGLHLEQPSQQGNDPSMSPYGSTEDDCWNPNNDQYGWAGQNYGCNENYRGNDGGLSGSGDCGCGWNQLSVNGNSVDTGRYIITASTDGGGTLEVKDKTNGQSFKVWGDPHVTTDKGDTTDFQKAPATFKLPDGTEITVDPTQVDSNGVAYIDNATITKGNNAVTMTGFHGGNLQTQALPGEGRYLDQTTPDGTVLTAENGQIDQLMLPDGTEINGNNVKNIDSYANRDNASGQIDGNIVQLQQEIAGLEQQISQIESMTLLSTTGFMANPLQNDRI